MSLHESDLILSGSAAREVERQWVARGGTLPVQQRSTWPRYHDADSWHLVGVKGKGEPRCLAGVWSHQSRAIPGYRILRVQKFGPGLDAESRAALFGALSRFARSQSRVLRLVVESVGYEAGAVDAMRAAAIAEGFHERPWPRHFRHTLLVNLSGSEDEFLARIDRSVRKNERKTAREGHLVAPILDNQYAQRIRSLVDETMNRTAGDFERSNWAEVLHTLKVDPTSHRMVGLFLHGDRSPPSLVAVRWVGLSGSYAEDLMAASTRVSTATGSIPMMPAIMLDQLLWAKRRGAEFFDFGGVVLDDDSRHARLGGISVFKSLFSSDVRDVGVDFEQVISPLVDSLANLISKGRKRIQGKKK